MRHGEAFHNIGYSLRFSAVGFEKLQPCGRGEKKIGHFDFRALRAGGRRDLKFLAEIDTQMRRMIGTRATGDKIDTGHRGNGGQSLAAKAKRRNIGKIAIGQFGGGMTIDSEDEIVCAHALAIIHHADETPPALLQCNIDTLCTGIERILDEFLDGRSRTLDNLARSNAINEDGIEAADGHGVISL
jgi:hypothetical protein